MFIYVTVIMHRQLPPWSHVHMQTGIAGIHSNAQTWSPCNHVPIGCFHTTSAQAEHYTFVLELKVGTKPYNLLIHIQCLQLLLQVQIRTGDDINVRNVNLATFWGIMSKIRAQFQLENTDIIKIDILYMWNQQIIVRHCLGGFYVIQKSEGLSEGLYVESRVKRGFYGP